MNRRRAIALAAGLSVALSLALPSAASAAVQESPDAAAGTEAADTASAPPPTPAPADDAAAAVTGKKYPGDPDIEALLVASEDRRLIDVRAISNAAGWTNINQGRPYRLITGNTYTLVLIRRDAPYTVDDLLRYSPSTFVRQPDGSYLLTENIVVEQGATLRLASKDGLVVHMASTPDAFVSIVTIGGGFEAAGTAESPVEISGWDPISQKPDEETSDGRAYIRVTGGHATFAHVDFHNLGFWSGATGGIALTGTATPDTLKDFAELNRVQEDEKTEVFGKQLFDVGGDDPATPDGTTAPDGTTTPDNSDDADTLDLTPDLSGYSYVSADIDDVSSHDNAFGLFITSAAGVDIRDSSFEHNLVDGLVLHRGVTDTIVHNTTVSHNGVDGLSVTRAATGVILNRIDADGNGRNGVTMEGGPLADGPSATGTPVGSYGNNELTESRVRGNGRYGVEVIGGRKIVIDGNSVQKHLMGIVVSRDVDDVEITDNIVEGSVEQGISLRDGVTKATVQGNSVEGGHIGIYLRNAAGEVDRNTVSHVDNHGITLIAAPAATAVTRNVVSGSGPSAVDVARAVVKPTVDANQVEKWVGTKPLDVILRGIFQPLTVLWIVLGLIVLITAMTGVRRRRGRAQFQHPYDSHRPLSALTAGIADPAAFGRGET